MKTILIDVSDEDYNRLMNHDDAGYNPSVEVRVFRLAEFEGDSAYILDGDEDRETKIQSLVRRFDEQQESLSADLWLCTVQEEHEHWLRTRTDKEIDEMMHEIAAMEDEDA